MPACLEVASSGKRKTAVNAKNRAFKRGGDGRRKAPISLSLPLSPCLPSLWVCVGRRKMDGIGKCLWGALYRIGVGVSLIRWWGYQTEGRHLHGIFGLFWMLVKLIFRVLTKSTSLPSTSLLCGSGSGSMAVFEVHWPTEYIYSYKL